MTPPPDLPVAGRAGHATPDEAALRALAERVVAEVHEVWPSNVLRNERLVLARAVVSSAATLADLRARLAAAGGENERRRGITPELPPRPPGGEGLPRYGLGWNGPSTPLSVPMADGYWTPYHLAEQALAAVTAELENCRKTSKEVVK